MSLVTGGRLLQPRNQPMADRGGRVVVTKLGGQVGQHAGSDLGIAGRRTGKNDGEV